MASSPESHRSHGLSAAEAHARLGRYGPNVLPRVRPPSRLREFAAQLVHFFALLLWAAAAFAYIAGMPQLAIAIVAVVVVNAVFAFVQEFRAERAAARLAELLPSTVTVIRDGERCVVEVASLVPDDLVTLEPGDRVSADLRIVEAHALRVDESMLTGESVAVDVGVGASAAAGTFVVAGDALGIVVATGAATRLAGITQLTREARRPRSPLDVELDRVVRTIAAAAAAVGAACFVAATTLGLSARDGFLIAIGVMVALVPEGLLPTITLSLAVGAQRMAARSAVVRHLEAVETLGATTCICTDKTGTLTMNEMVAERVWTPAGTAVIEGTGYGPTAVITGDDAAIVAAGAAAGAAAVCTTASCAEIDGTWRPVGDPMEAALWLLARRLGAPEPVVVDRTPFDPARRCSSATTDVATFVLGAPDALLPRCTDAAAADALHELTTAGLRVVAATRVVARTGEVGQGDTSGPLVLLGLIGLVDPPRPTARTAIVACRAAGIKVTMLTGDHPGTAVAVARAVGLAGDDATVITGDRLPDDAAALGALVDRDGIVLARVDPQQKLAIAHALQERGHVVAMTGDGVNDGPALREADVGVAMGRHGTDVARAAADLVLLDDSFDTIVEAVRAGRSTFRNIRRFLAYHLCSNVAELAPFVVWSLSGGRFPLAIGVLQILTLDLGTDLLPALALGAEPPPGGSLPTKPNGRHLVDRALLARVFGRLGLAAAVVEMAAFTASLYASGWHLGAGTPSDTALRAASGAAFSAVVIAQVGNAFACRSEHFVPWRLPRPTNYRLIGAVAVELGILAGSLYIVPVAHLLHQAPPTAVGASVALFALPVALGVDWFDKHLRRRRKSSRLEPFAAGMCHATSRHCTPCCGRLDLIGDTSDG